ncbi:MAG: bifunctional diaminohydroxyphosphoribosylaminopyrimidine deaminase/5-amino-6-(5-phosphoribosylamino)uracil reductase RibD [Deltaproteobacteria bacterium]|jgi:diaminohydroxyphosphoribosylaminopyrimidine deaminase/5-amino-6-(5-phosphoribosylamino)uracil reductase|nr:bifunctional diaminohydroxyphosphoribosylaminopyrimidine deaminase/5-amino-6-(5-phosphoribosylamino)uracil reductase RibD [Deltaproteobacteria bacterium]
MSYWSAQEVSHMKEAIRLARQGWGLVSPNPMVGAALVKKGKIIATGWHAGPGQPHAEIVALAEAGKKAQGATLFVNLEPCRHVGRTGPCVDAIIQAKVAKVHYSIPDPHPEAGGGAKILADAGIEVDRGLLSREAIDLNQFFLKSAIRETPFVIIKTAASLDGKISTGAGDSRWISSKVARNYGHHLRAGVDAILIGRATAAKDDPELSARPWGRRKMHRQPWRAVLDASLKLPLSLKLFDPERGGPSVAFAGPDASERKAKELEARGVKVIRLPVLEKGLLSLTAALKALRALGVQSVLIEPGATLASSALILEPIVDLGHVFLAPKFIGGFNAPSMLGGAGAALLKDAKEIDILRVARKGPDLHLVFRPKEGFALTLSADGELTESPAEPLE